MTQNIKSIKINQKFKMLTVISICPLKKYYYICKCDCGNETTINKYALLKGQQSCGCILLKHHLTTGMKFGKLTTLSLTSHKGRDNSWECICECGNKRIFAATYLANRINISCGCANKSLGGFSKKHPHEYQKQYNANYYKKNKDKCIDNAKRYAKTIKGKQKEYTAISRLNCRIRHRLYIAHKMKNDLQYKLASNLRRNLNSRLRGRLKAGSAVDDLGCTIEEFKLYIASKFYNEPTTGTVMSWENYGRYGWHIDHILPLSSFDLTNREHILKVCHYTNLQPLWWWQNISKGGTKI